MKYIKCGILVPYFLRYLQEEIIQFVKNFVRRIYVFRRYDLAVFTKRLLVCLSVTKKRKKKLSVFCINN